MGTRAVLRDYRRWLDAAGVDTSLVKNVAEKFTASFFCSTDVANNQIASFYTGAMAHAAELSFRTGDRWIWRSSRRTIRARCPIRRRVSRPGDSLHLLRASSAPGYRATSCSKASRLAVLICNDYELELIRQKTGLAKLNC